MAVEVFATIVGLFYFGSFRYQIHKNELTYGMLLLASMDVLDANAEDVRFLQATRHGEVSTSTELIESHERESGEKTEDALDRLREGESLGIALVRACT